jgi:outer membrane protein TolC
VTFGALAPGEGSCVNRFDFSPWLRVLACFACAWFAIAPRPAFGLQPLSTFIQSSHKRNPDNLEAEANVRQSDARADAVTGALLPRLSAEGIYTRNQYEAVVTLPGAGPELIITPENGLDGFITLSVPLFQGQLWAQRAAAKKSTQAASATRDFTELSVEESVARAYYELLGFEAALRSTKQGLEVAQNLQDLVSTRVDVGIASNLDLQRAIAEVARRQQEVAAAELNVYTARRALETASRTTPDPVTESDFVRDDLHEEAPLHVWLGLKRDSLVAVRPAVLQTEVARENRRAAQAAWLPTLGAQAQEHFTNATGFTGRCCIYTLQAIATWQLDFTLAPNVRAETAALDGARAREDRARRDAGDAIYDAWHQVRASIERARAALPQVEAATLALTLARDRYENGVATQLDVIQAQRDQLEAEIASIQAQASLQYARVLLRLVSRSVAGDAP